MKSNVRLSTVICPKCKHKMNIGRKVSNLRKSGHIKDMYCSQCKMITPHVENPADKNEAYWILFNLYSVEQFLKQVRVYDVKENKILTLEEEEEAILTIQGEGEFNSTKVLNNEKKQDRYSIVTLLNPRDNDTLIRKTLRTLSSENLKLAEYLKSFVCSDNGNMDFYSLVEKLRFNPEMNVLLYDTEKKELFYINDNKISFERFDKDSSVYNVLLSAESDARVNSITDDVLDEVESQSKGVKNIGGEVYATINLTTRKRVCNAILARKNLVLITED